MTIETTRNISIIWLSLFCFVGLLPPVILLYFAVRGMNWVQRESKPIFQRAREGSDFVKTKTDEYSNIAADPLISVKQQFRHWQTTVADLLPRRQVNNSENNSLGEEL